MIRNVTIFVLMSAMVVVLGTWRRTPASPLRNGANRHSRPHQVDDSEAKRTETTESAQKNHMPIVGPPTACENRVITAPRGVGPRSEVGVRPTRRWSAGLSQGRWTKPNREHHRRNSSGQRILYKCQMSDDVL
jgi:hypothetical protein